MLGFDQRVNKINDKCMIYQNSKYLPEGRKNSMKKTTEVTAPVQKDYTRYAIWTIVAYLVFLTLLTWVSIQSLWVAVLA